MTDENTLVWPDAWRRARHPRRDRPDVPAAPAPDRAAAERVRGLVAEVRQDVEGVLALPGTAPDVAAVARAHLRGAPEPLGAAAVAHIVAELNRTEFGSKDARSFVDAWVVDHGVAFAAAAFTALGGIETEYEYVGSTLSDLAHHRKRLRWTGVRWRSRVGREWWLAPQTAKRLRALLAAAPEDVYGEAVAGIAEHRGHRLQRAVAAYLAPTREDWVEELCADPGGAEGPFDPAWEMLVCSLGRPHQPAAAGVRLSGHDRAHAALVTLIDGVGVEPVLPLLLAVADSRDPASEALRAHLDLVAAFPLDEAFRALVERIDRPAIPPAVIAAARRYPVRAMRLLPESAAPQAADLLSAHVRAHPEIAESLLPVLPAAARTVVRELLDANNRLPAAPDLPPLLTEPPWARTRAAAEPVVVKGLSAPGARTVVWAPGEREEWSRDAERWRGRLEGFDFADAAARFGEGRIGQYEQDILLVKGPDDLVSPLLDGWEPEQLWSVHDWAPPLVARFESTVHDAVLSAARRDPSGCAQYLLPLLGDEIACLMADSLGRRRLRGTARAWFVRHGASAAPALVPDALGRAGPARRAAEAALRFIADRHGPDAVVDAVRVHGDTAAAAIEALLATDPLDRLPEQMPDVEWVQVRALPQLLLRDRAHALPDGAAAHVVTMLAMSTVDEVYAGVRIVRDLCDPASLAEFGWALFRWWEMCGAPATENWALAQLALTGDDDTARRLTPVIRAWPGQGGHAKAVTGLDVLAAIGTDTALMHLHSISQRVKFKGIKARAQERIERLADELELTAEQLADRLVPDFGLDASGTLTLDYGPRRFTIGFDEALRPTIAGEDGEQRKSLPKPGANDDPELAPAAHKRFAGLKKDVRTVATDQLARFESAMVAGRHRPVGEFREYLVAHPLVGHLVRRLVWLADDGSAFRVAEDGTFADAADATVSLPATAQVRVAHPAHLGDGVKAWAEVFADYGILQPFEQLARPVHTLTGDERDGGRLARFEGVRVAVTDLLGLTRRGWERGPRMDAGIEWWISRRVASGRYVVLTYDFGLTVGDREMPGGAESLADVRLTAWPDRYKPDRPTSLRLGDLDPGIVSEVLADLVHLTADAEAVG
ncbi:hypothetical protein GCM10010182_53100 [Actinomadura cremea]|nr:hypothetical protein GCM10010182_53100 [Actinomadura cremea]